MDISTHLILYWQPLEELFVLFQSNDEFLNIGEFCKVETMRICGRQAFYLLLCLGKSNAGVQAVFARRIVWVMWSYTYAVSQSVVSVV